VSFPTQSFVEANKPRLLEELLTFLRIPSVSAVPEHKADVKRAAEFVAAALRSAKLENVEVIETKGHPLVYADWLHAPGKPTVLCYGHYDVQPPDPLDEWVTPPFEPTIRNGNIYARGSTDDKGQMYMHIKAVESLFAAHGTLPLNLKFLFEGEEESGGEAIADYLPKNTEKLKADVALVSDTEFYAEGLPTLCVGLRGLIYTEIEARGAARDLHSGTFGGAAPNAIFAVAELLTKLKDANGHILIPGMYDDVTPPTNEEKESWDSLPFDEEKFRKSEVGSKALTGEPGFSVMERTWARPTLEVHGIVGGYMAPGAKTVIPAKATAKVSMRLVPDQKPDKIVAAYKKFVADNTPRGIQTEVRILSAAPASSVNPAHPAIDCAADALAEVFGRPTVFIRGGGSIPIVGDFKKHLNIPTILMGFSNPDDGLHSPNEKYPVANYYAGIVTIGHFFEKYGAR
jgi:acetylornithine deacetylase/succinyl-diaminopimelate desuccinylase-like protein